MANATRTPALRAASAELERGRDAFDRHAWADAYHALWLADETSPLDGDDLERVALAAALTGRSSDFLKALDRAHRAHLDAGRTLRAARVAFWLGFRLFALGEMGRATGWLGRAERLVEAEAEECVERGYLLLPAVHQHFARNDAAAAYAAAGRAAAIGERFGEADLVALGRNLQGRALMWQGRVEEGLALLDEAMVAAAGGELSPLITGIVYCSVIDSCHKVYALARAREWTSVLVEWCEEQPQIVAFTSRCLVHRAEIMQLNGAWPEAIAEARRASAHDAEGSEQQTVAEAFYQEAEIHRLKGAFKAAEGAYRNASRLGYEPQPGLALLRLAEGRHDMAAATIRRALAGATDPLQRARLLPAGVEIMLALGDSEAAREACGELEAIAGGFGTDVLQAIAAHARGAVRLAEGSPRDALAPLRSAFDVWQKVGAPYIAARLRVLIGLACRGLGDEDSAGLEFAAARIVFNELHAEPDIARIAMLTRGEPSLGPGGLTKRELEVLRLVAAGKTNKAIAAELHLSGKTIDRHVSNIFVKLDVPSRTAATAYAYERKLI